VEVRVDELVGVDLRPIDVLVGGQVEDDVRPRPLERGLETGLVADIAERMGDPVQRRGVAGPAVGGQGRLVPVEERDPLRRKPSRKVASARPIEPPPR
jgi:hypothetical protein